MAVVHCEEITGRDGGEDILTNKKYVRVFQILTDAPADGAKVVLEYHALPVQGDYWIEVTDGVTTDSDPDAFCVDRRASQSDGDNLQNWTVICDYVGRGDPTLEPPDVQWPATKFQKSFQRDINGQMVANAAGDPFQSGLTRDKTRFSVVITKNVLNWNPLEAEAFQDTLNEDPFLLDRHPPGFPPGTCKLTLTAVAVWLADLSDIHYWKRTATVEVDLEGWDDVPLNAGFNHIVNGVKEKIILAGGGTPSTEQPLSATGARLDPDDEPVYCDGTGGAPGPFVKYQRSSWVSLNLEY